MYRLNPSKTTSASAVAFQSAPLRRPRILFFAPKECWPPNTGARLRNYYLARDLSRNAEVTYLAFADDDIQPAVKNDVSDAPANFGPFTAAHPLLAPVADQSESGCERPASFHRTVTVRRTAGYSISNLVRGAIGRTPITVLNYTTREMADRLSHLLEETHFDIVQIESIHLCAYLPLIRAAKSRPAVICDWHNVESELMWRYSKHEKHIARRLYARATARRIRSFEQRAIQEFDAHLLVSQRDLDNLGEFAPDNRAFVIENGVDIDRFSDLSLDLAHRASSIRENGSSNFAGAPELTAFPPRNRVVYVGSMDYHANEDAAVYFAHSIWPKVHQARPELKFTIVGRDPTPAVRLLARIPGVELTGTVEDVRPYYREAISAVVPLRVGGGSRLKILEAMAAGVPVISTNLGAEGLAVADGENIIIADSIPEFGKAIVRVSQDSDQWARLSDAGRRLVRDKYDWSSIGASLRKTHAELLLRRDNLLLKDQAWSGESPAPRPSGLALFPEPERTPI
jgi:glycosyltransferase involved in cell wall biosynthesis